MSHVPPDSTRAPREQEQLDIAALRAWWERHLGPASELDVRTFRGGQSNPTYRVTSEAGTFVLRKKPPGALLPKAHMVEREHRVMAALAETAVPVPRMLALCEDPSVVGTPFFVMEHVEGRTFWNVQLPDTAPKERAAIYAELARVLATIHGIDVDAVGLSDYGRRKGYVSRQVARWSAQYEASRTTTIPAMDALLAWLPKNVPPSEETTLVHGDIRLDNLLFHPREPRCVAVLDWELSTLGHPLADLAYACMLYDVQLPRVGGLLGVDFEATGVPREEAFVAAYAAQARREVPAGDWAYFKAFGLFRLAAIAQGVYKRSIDGNASSPQAFMFGAAVGHLAGVAARLADL